VPGTAPPHLRPGALVLVFAGGSAGTGARALLAEAVPSVGGLPVAILGINIVGAFALGFLLDALARRGPDTGARRLRLLLGTGLLGGFTTYSALSLDTAGLLADGHALRATAYGLGSVVGGLLAAGAGAACAMRSRRGGPDPAPEAPGAGP